MSSTSLLKPFVKSVETVENLVSYRMIKENPPSQSSTKIKNENVESVEANDLATYFSTLSTNLKNLPVEKLDHRNSLIISNLGSLPQVPQFPHEQKQQLIKVFEWLQIAIDEGHIEPAQPCVGRLLGWPQFSKHENSLWSDFILWGRKRGFSQLQIADNQLFFSV